METPESFNVTAGETATLECTVTGTPELMVKWFKDGAELSSGKKYKVTFSKMVSSLKFFSTNRNDTGEYTFEVKNSVGRAVSKVHLTVLG